MICVMISILYVSAGLKKANVHENFRRFIVPLGYLYFSKKERSAGYLERQSRSFSRSNRRARLQLPRTGTNVMELTLLFAPLLIEVAHAFDRLEVTVEGVLQECSFTEYLRDFNGVVDI